MVIGFDEEDLIPCEKCGGSGFHDSPAAQCQADALCDCTAGYVGVKPEAWTKYYGSGSLTATEDIPSSIPQQET